MPEKAGNPSKISQIQGDFKKQIAEMKENLYTQKHNFEQIKFNSTQPDNQIDIKAEMRTKSK